MLVLSRSKGERFTIQTADGVITIMVIDIRGDETRIGIDAPRDMEIMRTELASRKKKVKESK